MDLKVLIYGDGNKMKVIKSIYPNKAYTCYITHGDGNYTYSIYGYNTGWVTGGNKNYNTLQELLVDLQSFYAKIELPIPKLEDIVAQKVWIEKDLYLLRNNTGLYDIVTSTGWEGDRRFNIVENFTLEQAIKRAKQIAELCNRAPE